MGKFQSQIYLISKDKQSLDDSLIYANKKRKDQGLNRIYKNNFYEKCSYLLPYPELLPWLPYPPLPSLSPKRKKNQLKKKNPHANKVKLMQVNSVHYQKHTKISKIAK